MVNMVYLEKLKKVKKSDVLWQIIIVIKIFAWIFCISVF